MPRTTTPTATTCGADVPPRVGVARSAFLVCRPATRYYKVMTRNAWQPVLIDEVI